MDTIAYVALRIFIAALNVLPLSWRLRLVSAVILIVELLLPRFRRIALINLNIAFPGESEQRYRQLVAQSRRSLSRLFVDFARLHKLDRSWVEAHVACPFLPRFEEIKAENPGRGVLIATGHLGSFELLAHCIAIWGYPISFVVRDFKLPRVDRWWRSVREAYGNQVISRKGAFKEMASRLAAGRDVAVLFDQNVTRNHAIFVDWFGRPAATARSLGLAALRTGSPVVVAAITYTGQERYRIDALECNFESLYRDPRLSNEDKLRIISETVSREYQQLIRRAPAEWFWMHRRWKTSEDPQVRSVYS